MQRRGFDRATSAGRSRAAQFDSPGKTRWQWRRVPTVARVLSAQEFPPAADFMSRASHTSWSSWRMIRIYLALIMASTRWHEPCTAFAMHFMSRCRMCASCSFPACTGDHFVAWEQLRLSPVLGHACAVTTTWQEGGQSWRDATMLHPRVRCIFIVLVGGSETHRLGFNVYSRRFEHCTIAPRSHVHQNKRALFTASTFNNCRAVLPVSIDHQGVPLDGFVLTSQHRCI